MPWQSGLTGIAYNPALTGRDIHSLADLFDARFKERSASSPRCAKPFP